MEIIAKAIMMSYISISKKFNTKRLKRNPKGQGILVFFYTPNPLGTGESALGYTTDLQERCTVASRATKDLL